MAKRKKNIATVPDNVTAPRQAYPAVSVVIPLYNAEKFIGMLLDSLLAQTFTDFEVIVVDDCSTDSSPAVVQSYAEKFGGRLTYVKRKKNFGGAAKSRNMGISLACGEYIQLIDNDDFLAKNALEVLYTAAKEYDADVVHTAARYRYKDGNATLEKTLGFTEKPVLEVENEVLMQKFLKSHYWWTPWTKFVRRKFLVENEIIFPEMLSHEDNSWTIELLCCAKKFLNIPNAVYYWRENTKSISRSQRPPYEHIRFWEAITAKGIAALVKLWNKYDVLKKNPEWLYIMLNYFFNDCFGKHSFQVRSQVSSNVIFEALRTEFAGDKFISDSYIPYLYSYIDSLQKQLMINNQKFQKFAAQAQKRITELEAQLKTK